MLYLELCSTRVGVTSHKGMKAPHTHTHTYEHYLYSGPHVAGESIQPTRHGHPGLHGLQHVTAAGMVGPAGHILATGHQPPARREKSKFL